jgi:hypothetical protein
MAHEEWYTGVANDIRSGVPDSTLMTRYKLTEADLAALIKTLVQEGFLTQEAVEKRNKKSKMNDGGTKVDEQDQKLVCPKCGQEYEGSVKFCPRDGSELRERLKNCPHCGNTLESGASFCGKCGKGVMDYSLEPPYYKEKFELFDKNGGLWKRTWNWPAFCLSAFWYLYKGMWGKALIMFGAVIILTVLLPGVTVPIIPVWAAMWGNYDYYLLKKYGEQWRFS